MKHDIPLLSICVPTYKRPELLRRALGSIANQNADVGKLVEVVVMDNEPGELHRHIVDEVLKDWPGRRKYCSNSENIGMVNNWNASVKRASGIFIHILHDDDYFLPGGLPALLRGLLKFGRNHTVLLFGVHVVNHHLRCTKRQVFSKSEILSPEAAAYALFTRASFVRFPAVVVRRDTYDEIGFFDAQEGLHADYDMWLRAVSAKGLVCVPEEITAYVIHPGCATASMFNEITVREIDRLICSAQSVLNEKQLEQCRSAFLNRFVLGGVYRAGKAGQIRQARRILKLLKIPVMQSFKNSVKWKLLRAGFRIMLAV